MITKQKPTIKLSKACINELKRRRIHHRQPYEEVIKELMKCADHSITKGELNPEKSGDASNSQDLEDKK